MSVKLVINKLLMCILSYRFDLQLGLVVQHSVIRSDEMYDSNVFVVDRSTCVYQQTSAKSPFITAVE